MNEPDYRDPCHYIDIPKTVNIPIELYESLKGAYFIGYADNLTFGGNKSAWARLYNPKNSGVNLHVNVWTVTDISEIEKAYHVSGGGMPPLLFGA